MAGALGGSANPWDRAQGLGQALCLPADVPRQVQKKRGPDFILFF